MFSGNDMTNEEVKELVLRAKSGDNEAWKDLYAHFERYVHECAWKRLRKLNMPAARKKAVEEDLYQAGWQGFLSAIRGYDPKQGQFLTYATHFIDGEMTKEMKYALYSGGCEKMPGFPSGIELQAAKVFPAAGSGMSVGEEQDRGKYSAERRVLQIMEILRLLTDEDHSLSKDELGSLLCLFRIAKYHNGTPLEAPNTLTSTLEDMLAEVDPPEYTGDNDGDYRIQYEGYRENRLKARQSKEKGKKAADLTGFSYVHTFSYAELDSLLQLVCFSDLFSSEEKKRLAGKLLSTSSVYYQTPFYDGDKLKFRPQAIHGRFSTRAMRDKKQFAGTIRLIQQAVNNLCQIRFRFNCWTSEHTMAAKTEYFHVLSPYHLVVYHDNYYCIGLKKEDRRIWHYRVDLMSEAEILKDEDGKPVPIDVCAFEGLPISNAYWDPEKYMAEHLYMAYDEPRKIRIKLRAEDYTILHDWFGDHYEKTDEITEIDENGREVRYDIAKVRTSPAMIVHWAMQYAGAVEVLDEEIREKIRDEIKKLQKKYE